ncbi:MAG: type I glyceraldehyde-3-phosphate dehydrogenase, partial [Candidatus Sungbacteria bacterium]|nr:type I glyceraldehyde-3-phosphate dehydrogenase [Candidatus Sungbacteria bacterium]
MAKIAINGFGRIGRAAFKIALAHDDIEVVAINDLGDVHNLAYLLRYDSVYGRYGQEVSVEDEQLVVADKKVKVFQEKDPTKLPWGNLGVDVVLESTGVFTEKEKAAAHLAGGAKFVII